MNYWTQHRLIDLLSKYKAGEINLDSLLAEIKFLPFKDLGYAKIDLHRPFLSGFPEVILARGKTIQQCLALTKEMLENNVSPLLVTKLDETQLKAFQESTLPGKVTQTSKDSWMISFNELDVLSGEVTVVTGGTADQFVASESLATLASVGIKANLLTDCGVAGLYRILSFIDQLQQSDVVIVIAGMEGALASVVASLTPAPVIAVPVSTGYGSSFEGISALLNMQSSCVPGITTVGIDNGFGAALVAIRILRTLQS